MTAMIPRRGLLFVISSPSGAGKTTLSRRLLASEGAALRMSVSATTRPMRPGEQEGRDYYFTDPARFSEMVSQRELLEHADVFGNRYGTPRAPVEAWLEQGLDVAFDVDWQGAAQIRASALGADMVSVFILPPSLQALETRLLSRNQDDAEVVARRMAKARDEISHCPDYDYVIVNDDLERAEAELRATLTAERLRQGRLTGLTGFLEGL